MKNTLEFTVSVDRTKVGADALVGLTHETLVNRQVLDAMPKGSEGATNLIFFLPPTPSLSNVEVEQIFAMQGLVQADPYALLAFNRKYPRFSDTYPHWTQWKNEHGVWCVMVFRISEFVRRKNERTLVRREVLIARNDYGWNHDGLLVGMYP